MRNHGQVWRQALGLVAAFVVLVALVRAQSTPELYADQFESAQLEVEVSDVQGAPLAGVSVSVGGSAAVLTGANGRATLIVGAASTQVVRITRSGYTDQFKPLFLEPAVRRAFLRAQLMPRAPAQVVPSIENGATIAGPDGSSLALPANALVGPGGMPVTGSVTIQMSPVDVSGPELGAFPGAFEGTDAGGARVPIVSAGTVEYLISQGGVPLQLASGASATLRIPVFPPIGIDGQPVAAGQAIPLWFLDESSGRWREEGQATVIASAASPSGFAAEGAVGHFSWWNLDQVPVVGFLRVKGFAQAGYRIVPDGSAGLSAISIGGGPSTMATTSFLATTRSLPIPVPADRDIALGLCAYIERDPPGPGDTPVLGCGTTVVQVAPQAVLSVDITLADEGEVPEIVEQPQDDTVVETRRADFDVSALSGDGSPLTYQWRRNGSDIGGATASFHSTPPTALADDGSVYTVAVGNDTGTVVSQPATLHVVKAPIPTVVSGPTCTSAQSATFGVEIPPGTSADRIDVRVRTAASSVILAFGTDTTAPYDVEVPLGTVGDGEYQLQGLAFVPGDSVTGPMRPFRVDRAAPTIVTRLPAPNSQLDAGVAISFTLDGPVDPASINDTTITLRIGGVAVGKTLNISPDGLTVGIVPAIAAQSGIHEILVDGIVDCGGNVLAPDSWTFEILAFAQLGTVVNLNDVGEGRAPTVAYDYQGAPWVSYVSDATGTANDRVLVRRFENGVWQVKGGQVNTLPAEVSGLTLSRIAIDGLDRAVVAFLQLESSIAKLRVRRFEGAQWVDMGSAPLNVTTGHAQRPMIAMGEQNRPIAAWIENGRIRVKRWDESSGTWLTLGPAEVAFSSQVGLATFDGVPYLSWGEFHSTAGNALNYTINAARYDETTNGFVLLFSDFRSATTVNHASIAVAAADSPYVAHGDTPFVVSGAPQPQLLRLVRRQAGSFEVVLPSLLVDPNGLGNITDSEFVGSSPAVAFLESVRDPMTGQTSLPRLYIRVGLPGGFTVESATITGATDLGIPDLASNPSTNLAFGRLGVVFSRVNARIAFKYRP